MVRAVVEDLPKQNFTADTIRRMYQLADAAKIDPQFQKLIYGVVNGQMRGQWKNYAGEITTMFNWLKRTVDYRRDPVNVELLQDPWATLDRARGDCDDFTVFLVAASEVLGAPGRIVTVSTRQDKEDNHVYAEAFAGGRWMPLDASVWESQAGWAPINQVTARRVWKRGDVGLADNTDRDDFEGLGGQLMNAQRIDEPSQDIFSTWTDDQEYPVLVDRSNDRAPLERVGGGGPYSPSLPVVAYPLPPEVWGLISAEYVPLSIDPTDFVGAVPTIADLNQQALLPGGIAQENNMLLNLAGLLGEEIPDQSIDIDPGPADLQIPVAPVIEDRYPPEDVSWQPTAPSPQTDDLITNEPIIKDPVAQQQITTQAEQRAKDSGMSIADAIKWGTTLVNTGLTAYNAVIKAGGSAAQAAQAASNAIQAKPVAQASMFGSISTPVLIAGGLALAGGAFLMSRKSGRARRNPSRRHGRRGGMGRNVKMLATIGLPAAGLYWWMKSKEDAKKAAMTSSLLPSQYIA